MGLRRSRWDKGKHGYTMVGNGMAGLELTAVASTEVHSFVVKIAAMMNYDPLNILKQMKLCNEYYGAQRWS